MRHERKGAIVGRVTHPKTKRDGAVRLDKKSMTFFARVPDEDLTLENQQTRQYFESKDGREVRTWLNGILAKQPVEHALEWVGVIEVEVTEDDGWHRRSTETEQRRVRVTAEIDRYWIALNPDKTQWLRLDWASCADADGTDYIAPEDRLAQATNFRPGPKFKATSSWNREKPFTLPSSDGSTTFQPYDDALWAGLTEVLDRLEESRKTLRKLLTTKSGIAMLAEVGRGQLRLGSGNIAPETVTEVVAEVVADD